MARPYETFTVELDDWLAVYLFIGGELAGHSSVRTTEMWSEWGPVGQREATELEMQAAKARVLRRARRMGPPPHDRSDMDTGAGWCAVCAAQDGD